MLPITADTSQSVEDKVPARGIAIAAWCLFDWAITPFPVIVSTFIISNYFAKAIAPDPTIGSAQWSFMIAIAGIVIALFSPPLGAIADRMGHAKRSIAICAAVVILSSGLLWFAEPDPSFAVPVLVTAGMGIVAMELGLLFYNALLPGVAPARLLGRVSGFGWAAGYVGGLACLALALFLLVKPEHPIFGIPREAAANFRACAPLAGLWLMLFGWPLFLFAPDVERRPIAVTAAMRQGLADLWKTLKGLGTTPQLAWFLVASALYRDGITTILAIGGLYAGGTFGMDLSELTLFGIGLNLTAGIGAAALAGVDDRIGSKPTIVMSVVGLIAFGIAVVLVHDKTWFVALALALGVFIGPAQAASRSLVVRLSPPREIGKMFGLYALTGRATSFIGPTLFGWVTAVTHSQRAGLGSILVLLVIGLAVLTKVRAPGRA